MIDVSRMTPAEVIAEADRRRDRRRRGLPLEEAPAEVAERIADDDTRLEKEIQRDVVKLYRANGCVVYNLSQARASKQSAGLGDMFVFNPKEEKPQGWWMECKTATGKPSPAQLNFEELCRRCGVGYVRGGVRAAAEHLRAIGLTVDDSL